MHRDHILLLHGSRFHYTEVRGAESDILSEDMARRMLASQPRARLVEVAGAGHTVPGDRPAEFLAALREFLDT
jgi:pimeloyl-ACP methyl ester carboxylesterase